MLTFIWRINLLLYFKSLISGPQNKNFWDSRPNQRIKG